MRERETERPTTTTTKESEWGGRGMGKEKINDGQAEKKTKMNRAHHCKLHQEWKKM